MKHLTKIGMLTLSALIAGLVSCGKNDSNQQQIPPNSYGVVPGYNGYCQAGQVCNNNGYINYTAYGINVVNREIMNSFLKETSAYSAQPCGTGALYGGTGECNNYTDAYVTVQLSSTSPAANTPAVVNITAIGTGYAQGSQITRTVQSAYYPSNSNQGFQLIQTYPYTWVKVRVNYGKVSDNYFDAELLYKDQIFATARLNRY